MNVDLAIVALIITLILVGVLWRFAWGPLAEALTKRETGIADEIAAAEANRQKAEQLLSEYETRLQKAGDEINAMRQQAKADAEAIKQSLIEQAQAAARREKERAALEIDLAKKQALKEITEQSINLAFGVAGEAVRRDMTPDDHRNLIEDALKQFSNTN